MKRAPRHKPDTGTRRTRPGRHDQAEQHLTLVLVGFATAVLLTRAFLSWTGYPQIATGEFHLAHVLWGGLLLFGGAMLLLIWPERRIYRASSLLIGVGFGLFIDEVGKFITRDNDYFYPLAAPIIYAAFLLTAALAIWVRDSAPGAAPGRAAAERDFDEPLAAAPHPHPAPAGQAMTWLFIVRSWITRNRRLLLAAGLGLLAIRGLLVLTLVTPLLWSQLIIPGGPGVAPDASAGPPAAGPVPWLIGPGLILEGLVGASLLLAGLSLLLNRPRPGLGMAYWGLLLSLAGLQPLIFYLNQFDLVVTTMTHIFVWWIVREQRRRLARPVAPGLSRPAAGRTD